MVKRTITITTIFLILTMIVGLIVMLNKSSFAADDDIASGTCGTCTWVIDSEGVLTISPADGVSGILADFTSAYTHDWTDYNIRRTIKKVIVEDGVKTGQGCYGIFSGLENCTDMNVSKLDTSNATDMVNMFSNCKALTTIDVSRFDTSKVTNMKLMFNNCRALTYLDLSGFNTSKVTNMAFMFSDCKVLTTIDVSSFNTGNVTDMSCMFLYCEALTTIDVSRFDTSKVTNMMLMFSNCKALTTVDVSDFNTGNVTDMNSMFSSCKALTTIDTSNFETSNVSRMDNMFAGCNALTSIDVSSFNTSNIIYIEGIFLDLYNLDLINLGENFSFNVQGNTSNSMNRALLPTPIGEEFTGKWIREDRAYGPYTAEELRDNYDGSTMAGNWIRERKALTVTYNYTGTIPEEVSELPETRTYEVGELVTVAPDATATGYTFSGWSRTGSFTMPTENVEITGYFIENPKSYNYKVEYYFDGELDDSLEEILNAEKDEEISITPQTPLKHGERNYTLISNNHNITISVNEEENVINVYYETDVLDYEIDNSEDTIEGDGIPDKYQIKITYKVENGTWDDGTKEIKTEVITLKDKNGNYAEDGTGELNIPQVGNKPFEGYTNGSWNKKIPKMVSSKDNGKEFIYSYKIISKANISRAEGKLSNPKTNDIMHNYLLVGIAGVLVLIVVRKIRRKYSRKAKKIQY